MNTELKAKILTYNKALAVRKEKADDLDVIVSQIMKLPYGQLKKVLSDEVVTVLEKYGYGVTGDSNV